LKSQDKSPDAAASTPPTGPLGAKPSATATIALSIGGEMFDARIEVPTGPTRLVDLLPTFHATVESLTSIAAARAEAEGKRISCAKGCGACCRQLVPIAEVEAQGIAELVDAMPEPRRSEVRRRFADARRRLDETGMLARLLARKELNKPQRLELGLDYFRLKIACPFLEEESCSIYADRPIACREYLVTSPPENCARPSAETVRMVPPLVRGWMALARMEERDEDRFLRWVPLVLAPEWWETHAEPSPLRPGTKLLETFFEKLIPKKKD